MNVPGKSFCFVNVINMFVPQKFLDHFWFSELHVLFVILQCQDTLVQFGSFLSMQLSTEEFVKRLPTIDTLITAYHVPADAAFFLCRPQYTYAINASLYLILLFLVL